MRTVAWALAAALAVCALFPPGVHGYGLAAVAALVALAAALAARDVASSLPVRVLWLAIPLVLFAVRVALAPGEAVEPVAVLLVAAIAGIAATAAPLSEDALAALLAALCALVGLRALYEAIWGLAAWAETFRAAHPTGEALAVLNRLEQGRPYGGFTTPAALGGFLALVLPAVFLWALSARGQRRIVGFLCTVAGGAGLVATRSIGAMAALGGALLLAALRGRVRPRVLAAAGGALAVAVLAVGLARPDAVFVPARPDSPLRLRAGNVRIALEIARDRPLVGAGPGGFAEAFPQYRREGDNESRHAHDLPAELVAEWGIPLGLALSALFFALFLGPCVASKSPPRGLAAGLAIGLAAFGLHNLVDFTAFLPGILVFAAIARGFIAPRAPRPAPRPGARPAWIAVGVAVALAAAASGAAREAMFAARTAAAGGDDREALRAAREAQEIAPWEADPPLAAAEALLASGAHASDALDEAERAVDRAPARAAARWARARARAATGDLPGAYADLVEAAALYPMSADYAARRDALAGQLRRASAGAPR